MTNPTGKIKRGMLFLSIEKAVNGSITLVMMPFIIRVIGIEQYGLWAILLGIFSYLQFLDLGLSFSTERFIAFHKAKNDDVALRNIITSSFTYMVLYSLVLLLLLSIAGRPVVRIFTNNSCPPEHAGILLRLFPALAAAILQPVFMGIPRGLQRFEISSKIQIAGKVIFAVSFFTGSALLHDINALVVAFTLQNGFTCIAYMVVAKKLLPGVPLFRLRIHPAAFRELLGFGFKIQISSIAFLVTQHFDKILLSTFFGLRYAGYYEAATRIIYAIRDIPLFLMSVLTPRITELIARDDRQSIAILYKKITAQLSIISFLLMAMLFINQKFILSYVLKAAPDPFTLLVFSVICLASFWHVISASATYVSRGMGRTSIEMNANLCTLITNVLFSLLLMKLYSMNGIVFGTGIAMFVSPFFSYVLTNRIFAMRSVAFFSEAFLQPLVLTVIMIVPAWILRPALVHHVNDTVATLIMTAAGIIIANGYYYTTGNSTYREFLDTGMKFLRRK